MYDGAHVSRVLNDCRVRGFPKPSQNVNNRTYRH